MLKTVGNPSTRYGDQTIVGGNLVLGTAGKGIDFSANGGNVLTQYDEGTWTATLTGTGGAPTTPVTVNGTYTQVGRQVTVQAYFENVDTIMNSYLSDNDTNIVVAVQNLEKTMKENTNLIKEYFSQNMLIVIF